MKSTGPRGLGKYGRAARGTKDLTRVAADSKIVGEWAGGSVGAEPRQGLWMWPVRGLHRGDVCGGSGGGLVWCGEGDFLAGDAFELADQVVLVALVVAGVVEVGSEVVEVGVGVGE